MYIVRFCCVALVLAVVVFAQPAAARTTSRSGLPADLKLPSDVTVAVYLPANERKARFYLQKLGFWLEPGKALEDSVNTTLKAYFVSAFVAEPSSVQPFGLLLAIHPKLKAESGTLRQTLKYKVIGARGEVLLQGEQSATAAMGDLSDGGGFYESSLQAMRLVVVDVLAKLRPDATKFPALGALKNLSPELVVDRGEAVQSGTGFFINARGQIMTAAHVVQDCAVVDVKRDETTLPSRVVAMSNLLDLAVLDTGTQASRFLPFRKSFELSLGEAVTNVGFPLQKILAGSANLTRGNVSSRGALAGSVGQFQFSAPIQPGSSGGPVVSDGGELLGVTVATLDVRRLIESGALPQNVNFALEARYAAMFLRKNNIAFSEVEPNRKGDIRTGNDAALATVVSLTCLQ